MNEACETREVTGRKRAHERRHSFKVVSGFCPDCLSGRTRLGPWRRQPLKRRQLLARDGTMSSSEKG